MRLAAALSIGIGLGFLVGSPAAAQDTPARTAARAVLTQYGDAIITVKVVLKRRMVYQGREQGSAETQMEIGGTVISPEGLTVVADSASNPSGSFSGGDTRIDTDTTDVKLLLRDGREIPAKFLLRDQDLDLAFIMPVETGLKLTYVPLVAAPVPAALDDVILLYRMGRTMGREAALSLSQVSAVVKRPRTFIVAEMVPGLLALGCPAFDVAGRAIGLVVMRRAPGVAGAPGSMREMLDSMMPVILTAADVAEVAAQAVRPGSTPSPAPSPAAPRR